MASLLKWKVIFVGLVLLGCGESWSADWKYFGAGGNGVFWWYDAQGLSYQPDGNIHVWVKKVKLYEVKDKVEDGQKVTLSELEQMSLGKEYERTLMEINCIERTLHQIQKLNYDSKGILKGGESKFGEKKTIPADSVAERLHQAVCR